MTPAVDRLLNWLALFFMAVTPVTLLAQSPPPTELSDYLKQPDGVFEWSVEPHQSTPLGKIFEFRLTSQKWRGLTWQHQLRVYEPEGLRPEQMKTMLLFITGGSTDSKMRPEDHAMPFALARACGSTVAVLPQVPNQPLLGDKREDDLISETFVQYLQTKEPDLPLLFPMVKSAVRAMDALQEWSKKREMPVEGFVVTGASKRGWTTWLTGASDPRVKAIAPMVIPTLNMKDQSKHQMDSWGKYSEQIEDYTRRGLTNRFDDPAGRQLWRMVDPYSYLDRIGVPILQINGTNDRYWTVDSVRVFWDAIRVGTSHVVYLPNAGHGLETNRDWAIQAVGALFRHVVAGQTLPCFHWVYSTTDGRPVLTLSQFQPVPSQVSLWVAHSATRDFRESEWKQVQLKPVTEDSHRLELDQFNGGFVAIFADLEYEFNGTRFHLSTPVAVFNEKGEVKHEPARVP